MSDCIKRQREIHNGAEKHRCINRDADTFRELVVLEQCDACPVKRILARRKPAQVEKCTTCNETRELDIHRAGYTSCPLRTFKGDEARCEVTGLPVDPEICGRCDERMREHTAGWGDKLVNFSSALRRWSANGCPTRTDEEVQQIFAEHCSKCDRFDAEKRACKACGCSVGLGSNPLTNKLKMATEPCPLGRF